MGRGKESGGKILRKKVWDLEWICVAKHKEQWQTHANMGWGEGILVCPTYSYCLQILFIEKHEGN